MTAPKQDILILYDGECPFCSRYVQWLHLKENLAVTLVNARENSALRDRATQQGYDLDHGMLVEYGGRSYFANDALMILSLLSTRSDLFNKLVALLFSHPRAAKLFYPFLSFMRRVAVLGLGRGLIRNLKK